MNFKKGNMAIYLIIVSLFVLFVIIINAEANGKKMINTNNNTNETSINTNENTDNAITDNTESLYRTSDGRLTSDSVQIYRGRIERQLAKINSCHADLWPVIGTRKYYLLITTKIDKMSKYIEEEEVEKLVKDIRYDLRNEPYDIRIMIFSRDMKTLFDDRTEEERRTS